jgi:glycine betaine/proline transport system permease protein
VIRDAITRLGPLLAAPLEAIRAGAEAAPAPLVWWLLGLMAWRLRSLPAGVATVVAFVAVDAFGLLEPALETLALAASGAAVGLAVAVLLTLLAPRLGPVGPALRRLGGVLEAVPGFAYLVPAAALFGLGEAAAVLAVVAVAVVVAVRAGLAAPQRVHPGGWRPLLRPVAHPTLLAALAMSLLAGLLGARGLGGQVLALLPRLEDGVGGLARADARDAARLFLTLVVLGLFLDRVSTPVPAPTPRWRWPRRARASTAGGELTAGSPDPATAVLLPPTGDTRTGARHVR